MNLVLLRTYTSEPEAEIFRVFLEENGVDGFVFNVNSAILYPMFNNTLVGVQLKVRHEDQEKARKLMAEFYPENEEIRK